MSSAILLREHISWRGFATEDDLATVRAYYAQRFSGPAAEGAPMTFEADAESGEFALRGSNGELVSAHVAGSGHPTCDVSHAPSDRTYLVVSTRTR